MKSILMTTSAVILVSGVAAGQALAACPEDIDAFTRQYEEALQTTASGQALSTAEQAELFGLKTAAENMHTAGDSEMCAEIIQRANAILDSAIAPQVMRPDELIGRDVTNAAEENLGEIEEIMLDPVSGRIAYVLIEHGGFLGIGDNLFAVPWRALTFVPGEESKVILEIPEERLENAPRFSRDDETPLERREWVTSVHNYYGVEPYWQQDLDMMALQYGSGSAQSSGASSGGASSSQADIIVIPAEQGSERGAADQQGAEQDQGQPATGASETESGSETEAQPDSGSGGTGTRGSAEPAGQSSETQAAADPQDEGSEQGSDTATMALSQPAQSGAGQSAQAGASGGQGAQITMLVSRIDALESAVETMSEQGQDDQVAALEERVTALEEEVQTDLKDTIARVEQQIEELRGQVEGGAAAAQQTEDQAQQGQLGQTQQDQASGQGQQGQQSDQAQQDQASAATQRGQAGQPQSEQPVQSLQPASEAGQAQQTRQAQPGQAEAQDSEQARQSGQQAQGSEQAQAGGDAQAEQDQATSAQQSEGAAAEGQASGEASGEQADGETAALSDTGGIPCEEQVGQLEDDIEQAETLGMALGDAKDALRDARANAGSSDALCRAAIKRAHDSLVAIGFEPTPLN